MGVFADTINKLKDELEAARIGGQPLDYFKHVYFGERDNITTLGHPYMWVHLRPVHIDETWSAARNVRDTPFTMLVNVAIESQDETRPYGVTGDTTKRGILVAVADVMNEIDNRRVAILGSNINRNYDLQVTVQLGENIGNRTFSSIIEVEVKQRYTAGDR